jgi:hypothetical protein
VVHVPKAAMYEYDSFESRQNDIRLAGQVSLMDSEAKT